MAAEPDEMPELPPPTPAPAELCERAAALVRNHRECFWFWHPDALSHPENHLRHLEDVRLVVEHLREYGGHRAWCDAQDLQRCLSPLYKKTS
ncbi:MAG: hypothetical protein IH623_26120 [Verrucomicrobia bacterium]|nr:hypothetical protein [Verrucomicrobiota bacterium]